VDVQKIRPVDLRGGVARQGQRQIIPAHAAAIIRDPDQTLAAFGIVHGDPPRPGIKRVFDQFLDGRGGPLHDLTRRDPVDRRFVQLPDRRALRGGVWAYLGVALHDATIASMGGQIRP
jgi:hypothetical protein